MDIIAGIIAMATSNASFSIKLGTPGHRFLELIDPIPIGRGGTSTPSGVYFVVLRMAYSHEETIEKTLPERVLGIVPL